MQYLDTIPALEALYGTPGRAALDKVAPRLTPLYRKWILQSRFCVLSTVGPEGTDGSPRGDDRPVVQEWDAQTLLLPDWRGNNRMDSLRNIVADGRVSLMFMVPGSDNVVRVNGQARITADAEMLARFDRDGRLPRSVIVIRLAEVYAQCARAVMRAGLWSGEDASGDLPGVGAILEEMTSGAIDGASYDAAWPDRAAASMW
ncbi:pyridoxamine 5'-phosphate oxidase family protein [Pseudooceanicola aestuarii]|uniref:pyridoxamine 5'-phosphate oxidase family protein n=1 Tax=Pseudooceanicola aestuarii TaxID=2697319 RepID=UPI0013D3F4AF|nr:pyridoxamine 5'-phosphate oxidase family protein [Pseudooceanicola aestuarii]